MSENKEEKEKSIKKEPDLNRTMKSFKALFIKMIGLRKKEKIPQREFSERMEAVYHYVNKIEKDVKNGNLDGKTVHLAARYAASLGYTVQFSLQELPCKKKKKTKKKASKK